MPKILPHTERFILIFNKLKNEKKLPSNEILAQKIGLNSGNSITEIKNRRQNIGMDVLQKFCDLYGKDNGFTMDAFTGNSPFSPDDHLNWERAVIKVLTHELAKVQSKLYNRPVEDCLEEIDKNTTLTLADLRRSDK
ncbi:hypothetical protein PV783_11430 [Chitinophaga sp. CC14]|uniref:hypothetical protein n=1 Tax=Chitinophaga sp. CC14 TaxID=3029199 RepID=UPI003B7E39B4